ncbi:UBX domain-containing protein 8 isoform X1 [Salvelinus namaycush]|uniref:UBX domain-containing protein 8 isoform X1 n=1 Tax=Salvelinus namaycush TaxID=8040 RepID=A0A8U0PNL2_SALNM|nr:UBX domain-containing protein 8 isoform X1 [Salvelinus namaycush]
MSSSKTSWLLGTLLISILCFVSWKHSIIDVRGAFLLVGRGLLLLGLSTLMLSYFYPRLRSLFSSNTRSTSEYSEDEEAKQRQKQAREELQEKHSEKAFSYQESVLRPRQESSMRKKEERFYRMTGEAWKLTEGEQLGEGESLGQRAQEDVDGTPNQEAVRRRKLPESATRLHPKLEVPPQKRVVVLPEEPAEDAEGVVRVALRCPSGRTIHRRFLKSDSSSVLLDWLLKTGYHPAIYTLCTTYPRQPLVIGKDISMGDAGILTHTVLNVEVKDPSTT